MLASTLPQLPVCPSFRLSACLSAGVMEVLFAAADTVCLPINHTLLSSLSVTLTLLSPSSERYFRISDEARITLHDVNKHEGGIGGGRKWGRGRGGRGCRCHDVEALTDKCERPPAPVS